MSWSDLDTVAVVVPVHDEQELLPGCLAALRAATGTAADTGIDVSVTVVLDACTDSSREIAVAAGVEIVSIDARNVGSARAAGVAAALRAVRPDGAPRAPGWLAMTDADTVVGPGWLLAQLAHARAGADLVLGTVAVGDWAQWPAATARAYAAAYAWPGSGGHHHVHGANLGIRAATYRAAGGFAPLATAEDEALVAAVTAIGGRIVHATDLSVVTSARPHGRAPDGFSHYLRELSRSLS